jgi:hypothetical protein
MERQPFTQLRNVGVWLEIPLGTQLSQDNGLAQWLGIATMPSVSA